MIKFGHVALPKLADSIYRQKALMEHTDVSHSLNCLLDIFLYRF